MLYQSADDNLSYEIVFFTFPGEIICRVGKTGEDVQRKQKRIRKLFIHISVKEAKKIYQPIFKAALFEFSCILFKILLIKNIPKPHSGAFNLVVMNRPKR